MALKHLRENADIWIIKGETSVFQSGNEDKIRYSINSKSEEMTFSVKIKAFQVKPLRLKIAALRSKVEILT